MQAGVDTRDLTDAGYIMGVLRATLGGRSEFCRRWSPLVTFVSRYFRCRFPAVFALFPGYFSRFACQRASDTLTKSAQTVRSTRARA